jgi:pilus assembly protein Flp/PilA
MVSMRHLVCFWCFEGSNMKTLANIAGRFREEEDGAAMIEYSILVGIIAVTAIGAVLAIGGWVSGRFNGLCTALDTANITGATCDAAAGTGT